MKCKKSHHCVVFSSPVLPDGKGRKEEVATHWVHLHSSVQLTNDYSRFCLGKIFFFRGYCHFHLCKKSSVSILVTVMCPTPDRSGACPYEMIERMKFKLTMVLYTENGL